MLRATARGFGALPHWKQAVIIALGIAAIVVPLGVPIPSPAQWRVWTDSLGGWFIVIFALSYIVATQFPIPRTVFTLASGVLLGPGVGIVVALACTTISAFVSLTVVRGAVAEWIRPRLTHPAVERINARLRSRGWLAITSLRMIAGVPFSLLNYVAAVSHVPRGMFTVATLVGSAPGTIATVLLGSVLTHDGDWRLIVITAVLMALGFLGLLIDAHLPTAQPHARKERYEV